MNVTQKKATQNRRRTQTKQTGLHNKLKHGQPCSPPTRESAAVATHDCKDCPAIYIYIFISSPEDKRYFIVLEGRFGLGNILNKLLHNMQPIKQHRGTALTK